MLPWPPCLDSPRLFLRICALKVPLWGQNLFEVSLKLFNFFDTLLSKLPMNYLVFFKAHGPVFYHVWHSLETRDYSYLSNKHDVMFTNFRRFHPARNKNPLCMFINFITNFSIFLQKLIKIFLMVILSYKSIIVAQKLMEKFQLILHPYTFIPTYTIREMRVTG